jgi:PAS domain S-box-containing protein
VHLEGTPATEEGEKMMVAPLLSGEHVIGAMSVWRGSQDLAFTQSDLNFLVGLSRQAMIAFQNARLFEQAQEAQRRLADIVDFLPDATLVMDRAGRVMAWNRAIEEMTGIKAQDMIGKGNYEYAIPFYGERRPILIDLVLLSQEEIEKRYAQINGGRSPDWRDMCRVFRAADATCWHGLRSAMRKVISSERSRHPRHYRPQARHRRVGEAPKLAADSANATRAHSSRR